MATATAVAMKPRVAMDKRDKVFVHNSKWPKRVSWHSKRPSPELQLGEGEEDWEFILIHRIWQRSNERC
ncbi:hypothetical protein NL676_002504 [Syzygium grande]|nr:hypothetical protein NL676_002504 [Syzygium grande]